MMNGKLITFEGIDGSGKSTIARILSERIGETAVLTVEPTKSWIGKSVIRAMEEQRDPITIALLFIADRKEHLSEIEKWLDEGKLVICDRFIDSTFAYQKEHLNIPDAERWLSAVHEPFLIKPDVTFLLRIAPEKAMERIEERVPALFEHASFLARVQENYLDLAERERERFVIMDAEREKEELVDECLRVLKERGIL